MRLLVAAVVEGVLVILVTTAEEVSLSTAKGTARAFAKSLGVDVSRVRVRVRGWGLGLGVRGHRVWVRVWVRVIG